MSNPTPSFLLTLPQMRRLSPHCRHIATCHARGVNIFYTPQRWQIAYCYGTQKFPEPKNRRI